MRSKQKNRTKRSSENKTGIFILIVSLIIILPLSYSTNTLDPTIPIRILILNIVLLVLLISLIIDILKGRQNFSFLKFLIYPVFAIYLLISLFSLTQAVNVSIGYYDLSKTFLSIILLIIATYYFRETKDFKNILSKAIVINLSISVSLGIYQYIIYASDKSGAELFEALYEIKGLMAHKNLFASSLFLLLPFSIYGVFYFKKWWLFLSIYSALLSLILIVLLQTRSVWIALFLFSVTSSILLVLYRKKTGLNFEKARKKKIYVFAFLFIVVFSGVMLYKLPDTRYLVAYKINSIIDINSYHNQGRLNLWESTFTMSKENIFFGVGVGNWRIQFPRYFVENHNDIYKNWAQPHNDFLWILSEKGIVGLMVYLFLFTLIISYGYKITRNSQKPDELIFVILLISMICGFVALSMLTFPYDRINHQIILILVFSSIIAVYSKYSISTPTNRLSPLTKVFILLIGFGLILNLYMNAKIYQSEGYVKKTLDAIEKQEMEKVIEYTTKAYNAFFTLDYFSIPLLRYRGTAYLLLKQKTKAKNDFLVALNDHPFNLSTYNNLSVLFGQQKNFPKAIYYSKKSLFYFPNYDKGIKNLSRSYYLSKNYTDAYLIFLRFNTKIKDKQYQKYKKDLELILN